MDGWMYRFQDGPVKGKTFGPVPHEPPERVAVLVDEAGTPAFADVGSVSKAELELLSEYVAVSVYTRTSMSQLGPGDPGTHLVKGADYSLEDAET